jgi:cellulose biosynthesis protein BcsQ
VAKSIIAFFNNKGGVGKTTLACNYAAYEASQGRRVLLLDLDPQCNSTQLLLDEDQWDAIYEDQSTSQAKTIMSLFRTIRSGDSALDLDDIRIQRSKRFKVDIVPGHPSLSIFEDIFSEAWTKFRSGDPGGARRSLWLRLFSETPLVQDFDKVVLDLSPSLGSINRTALIGSSYFLTPMAPDLFSLYALDNITIWFEQWLAQYNAGRVNSQNELLATGFEALIEEDLPIVHGYLGYTVQQYVSRTSSGSIRPVKAYDDHRSRIPGRTERLGALSKYDDLELGTVPNMFSMIPLAQSCHAPIADLTKDDGLRGAQPSQQVRYAEQLAEIFARVGTRLDGV